ncbi:MAG: stage III sporulation protein AF [Clostridia bacterium]|nr:stage III sporulation protein AF [Clostridia bacterium]
MIEFLKNWIFNIVTLVIFIVLLEILLPTGKMKKFINLVSGFILVIALINPFLGLARKGIDLKGFQLAGSNYLDKREIMINSKRMEEKQMQQVVEVYRKKMIDRLEEGLRGTGNIPGIKADILINEDYKSEKFGEIKRVYLNLTADNKPGYTKPVAKVEKIQIGDLKKDSKEKKADPGNEIDSDLKNKLEEKVNKLLDVKREDIVITMQKG